MYDILVASQRVFHVVWRLERTVEHREYSLREADIEFDRTSIRRPTYISGQRRVAKIDQNE